MKRRRSGERFALLAAVLAHVGLLTLLLRWGEAPPPPTAPVMVSLWDSQGPTSGPAPGRESGSPEQAAEPPPPEASSQPEAEAKPSPPEEPPADQPLAPPTPVALAEAPLEPPSEMTPDLTGEPVEPPTAYAADALGTQASAPASSTTGSAAALLAALGGAGDPCQLTEWLQGLLTTDPSVQGALARLPPDRRSVANAVMLWDGRWIEVRASRGEDLLWPIRQAILAGLSAAPAECRDHWMTGPRFISVADQQRGTVLALGSGTWRWSDLLATPADAAPGSPAAR